MTDDNTIRLHDVEGTSRLSGTDEHGCVWTQFEVDYGAEEVCGECSVCGKTISEGWMCLDGGEEVCGDHVELPDDYRNPLASW